MMTQCRRQRQLHFHSFGKSLELPGKRDFQPVKELAKKILVPGSVDIFQYLIQFFRGQFFRKIAGVKNRPNFFFYGRGKMLHIFPKEFYFSAVFFYKSKSSVYRGGLACAVFSDQAHDTAGRNPERNFVQSKSFKFFC